MKGMKKQQVKQWNACMPLADDGMPLQEGSTNSSRSLDEWYRLLKYLTLHVIVERPEREALTAT
uniref:Uncharacterized protein n=1 Tax=Arundo donax TaxID=35708 RepID=A0A0A9A231_ARUDO